MLKRTMNRMPAVMKRNSSILVTILVFFLFFPSKLFPNKVGFKFGVNEKPLRYDYIDLDSDGVKEAVVTSVLNGAPSSYVLKTSNGKHDALLSNLPYFFRVINIKGSNVLIGQKSTDEYLFAGAVFMLSFKDNKIIENEKMDLPKKVSLYTFVDQMPDGRLFVRDESGRLLVYKKNGKKWKRIYRGKEKYHIGNNCFARSAVTVLSERREEEACLPVPPVIYAAADGSLLIVDSNEYHFGGVIMSPAVPKKSFIELLSVRDDAPDVCAQLGPFDGAINDFHIDPDDNGKLVVELSESAFIERERIKEINISGIDCNGEF